MTLGERISLIIIAVLAVLAAVTSMCRRPEPPVTPSITADTVKVSISVDTTHAYSADSLPSKRKKALSDSTKVYKNTHTKPSKSKLSERSRTLTPEEEAKQFK